MSGRNWVWWMSLLMLVRASTVVGQVVLDDFEEPKSWQAISSEGARAELARDEGHGGMGMRLDFDLGAGGYAIVRKDLNLALPPNYAIKFWMRGEAQPNSLEIKLVGRNGDNVWWFKQPNFTFHSEWREVVVKKSRIDFAWGPLGGGPPRDIVAIEIALSAGQGGKGSLWIDDLRLEKRETESKADAKPKVSASTSLPGHEAAMVIDQRGDTTWHSGTIAAHQWLIVDFTSKREYGGLVIDWAAEDYAVTYDIDTSDDGKVWNSIYHCAHGNGGRDYVYTPDAESRFLRIYMHESSRGEGYAIKSVTVAPYELSVSPNRFFELIARDASPGTYPKYFSDRQTYWTVVGVEGDSTTAIFNEEGAVEPSRGSFSLEPFLYVDGSLLTWSSVQTSQELEGGYVPIPSVNWQHEKVGLKVTAVASGKPGHSALQMRYQIQNRTDAFKDVVLFLAVRPFQVLPPWQNLNLVGGVTAIDQLALDGRTVVVNHKEAILCQTQPQGFGASTFDEGMITDFLAAGRLPPQSNTSDPFGYASGALMYNLRLDPNAVGEVFVALPSAGLRNADTRLPMEKLGENFQATVAEVSANWHRLLDRVELRLPPPAERIVRSIRSTIAYTLVNRHGDALHPGPRTYARAWIRDGAMLAGALLEMGLTEEVRDFIRWFGQFQADDGRIPCCVDQRGPDRVPEHDSDGEFIYVIAEYYRYTHDVGFLQELWPRVLRAVDHLIGLRAQRLGDEYRQPDKQVFFGLLPPSISHEGYSSRPVHSYWDDFFALRGFKDAASLAVAVGDDDNAARFAILRDTFRSDLYASIHRTMKEKNIDFIPGSADLGDYDPTSTAIAITLGSERAHVPEAALFRTFDKYWDHVKARQQRQNGDEAYSAYELRNVGALVRLGQRDRAVELLEMLLDDQRPRAWNQWQEITWRDPALPRFIGDMPHTWVASSLVQSVRSFFAIERESDRSLVLGAGLPAAWVMHPGGVQVKRLPTHFGVLHFSLHAKDPNHLEAVISGDLSIPPGKIILEPPLPQPIKSMTVNGTSVTSFSPNTATVSELPAVVVLEY